MDSSKTEIANRNPAFGSSLLNENFGGRQSEGNLDPLQLKTVIDGNDRRSTVDGGGPSTSSQEQSLDSLMLQNPNGATQMFTDMHGIPAGLEEGEPLDRPGGPGGPEDRKEMQHIANGSIAGQNAGVTDWGTGTDGGRSDKAQVGVPYGTFTGV